MNIREISDALRINRNSVAKYLDVLTTREEVDFKVFGKSKVYYLSQRVPVTKLIGFSSNLMVILNRDLEIVQINDAFLPVPGTAPEIRDWDRDDGCELRSLQERLCTVMGQGSTAGKRDHGRDLDSG